MLPGTGQDAKTCPSGRPYNMKVPGRIHLWDLMIPQIRISDLTGGHE